MIKIKELIRISKEIKVELKKVKRIYNAAPFLSVNLHFGILVSIVE